MVSSELDRSQQFSALVLLADALCQSGQYKRSLKYFENAITLVKQTARPMDQVLYGLNVRYATACLEAKEYYRAKEAVYRIDLARIYTLESKGFVPPQEASSDLS